MNFTGMLKEGALKDKTILITGGGTGLGKSMGNYFMELGANLIITSRKEDVLFATAEEFSSLPGKVLPVAGDVRKTDDVKKTIERGCEEFGKIDILVNNAAGNFISPTERLTTKAFDVIIDIVLKGTYNYSLILGKKWIKEKQNGTMLNIVTTYAWTGSAYVAPSAAAKGGVLAFTRSIAAEWVKYGIRTNAIAPGPFPTKGAWDRLFPKPLSSIINFEKSLPMKRYGHHQELSNLAAYMVSDYSSYMNGEVVTLDSGEWIKNAGQFNKLEKIPNKAWGMIEKVIRGKKK
ncbi:MAG: SDR family oxidoreductase [Candidatus Neomarinimicrobiota bacterium]|nr:SDR family oxidoreductase [Candidatus Neomarinimicrobiota bacterium]